MPKSKSLTSIELFTGAGGLALGVARAGYKHLALVELNRDAVASLNENRGRVCEMSDWPPDLRPTDVKDVEFGAFRNRVSLIAAGAPCQPFSLGGKHRGDQDHRNLFPSVFRAVREVRPEVVIVENVRGLLRESFREYFEYIKLHLAYPELVPSEGEGWRDHRDRLREMVGANYDRLRYVVTHQLLNAADYGLPQKRERVFIVAFRSDLGLKWRDLKPTHSEDALLHDQWVTGAYWAEHGIRRRPPTPEKLKRRVLRLGELHRSQIKTARWRTVRDALKGLPEPAVGANHPSVLNHVANPGARRYPGHTGSPLDMPAKTLKAGDHGVPGGENMLVADDDTVRYFTVREAARLQGFPDEYHFKGAWCEAFRQLGNAVPVTLAEVVASRVREMLESVSVKHRFATDRLYGEEALASSA